MRLKALKLRGRVRLSVQNYESMRLTLLTARLAFSLSPPYTQAPTKESFMKFLLSLTLLSLTAWSSEPFRTLGKYVGTSDKGLPTVMNTQKFSYTSRGLLDLYTSFHLPEEDSSPHSDSSMVSLKLSLENYRRLFETDEEIKDLVVQDETAIKVEGRDVYQIVTVDASGDPGLTVQGRNIEVKFVIGDRGRDTRNYWVSYKVLNHQLFSYSIMKELKRRFFGGWVQTLQISASNLQRVQTGLELMDMCTVLEDLTDIEQALNNPTDAQFIEFAQNKTEKRKPCVNQY